MNPSITILITSCGRMRLLRKTVLSLSSCLFIEGFPKLLVEDSVNDKHIEKICYERDFGFLQGWKVFFSSGIGSSNQEKHYNALSLIYSHIETPYVFHCEDDWTFLGKHVDLLESQKSLLDTHPDVGIVLLRNYLQDGGFNHIEYNKRERHDMLFQKSTPFFHDGYCYKKLRNDLDGDSCRGFSYNPGLRRTYEMVDLMFGYEKLVRENLVGERYARKGLYSLCLSPGIAIHSGNHLFSTGLFANGFFVGLFRFVFGGIKYRFVWLFRLFRGFF